MVEKLNWEQQENFIVEERCKAVAYVAMGRVVRLMDRTVLLV